jgi:hypothetical protein
MTLVRMIRSWRAWNAGETAAFTADVADELVRTGVAEIATPEPSAEVAPARSRARK